MLIIPDWYRDISQYSKKSAQYYEAQFINNSHLIRTQPSVNFVEHVVHFSIKFSGKIVHDVISYALIYFERSSLSPRVMRRYHRYSNYSNDNLSANGIKNIVNSFISHIFYSRKNSEIAYLSGISEFLEFEGHRFGATISSGEYLGNLCLKMMYKFWPRQLQGRVKSDLMAIFGRHYLMAIFGSHYLFLVSNFGIYYPSFLAIFGIH